MTTTRATSSDAVLKRFIAAANAQYRDAGLGRYQMRVGRNGAVTVPRRPSPRFQRPAGAGEAAGAQARAGAATTGPRPSGKAGAPSANVQRSGAAPKVSGLKQAGADTFQLQWQPIQGAKQYGIWQDGQLMGHVPSPAFAARVAAGASGTIQVDAVLEDGTRTELTQPLVVSLGADGKLGFGVPGGAPAGTASAPAAPAGAPASGPAPAPAPAVTATAAAAPAG